MAYVQAELIQEDPPSLDGRVHVVFLLTGDASETPRRVETYIDDGTTAASLRAWAWEEGVKAGRRKTIADQISVGQVFALTPPAAPPTPTAQEVWLTKARRLARLRELGTVTIGSTLATEIQALADDVRTSYQAGWIAGV
jgi:hypothetical protein